MADYSYRAVNREGKLVESSLDADSERTALLRLHEMGFTPLRVSTGADSKNVLSAQAAQLFKPKRKRVKTKDLLMFTNELNTLLRAGLPIDRSLMVLEQLAEGSAFSEIVHDILKRIKGGKSMSDAMADFPDVFPKVYTNMLKAGEMGGVIPQVLNELSQFLTRNSEMKSYLVSSLIYPALITVMMLSSILVMVLFVIPRFSQIFEDSKVPIPLPMQVLMDVSSFLISYWWAILAGIVLVLATFQQWRNSEKGRLAWDRRLLRFPMLGRLINRIEVARFCRTLGTLMQSAVPLVNALSLVKEVVANRVIANSIEPIKAGVKKGDGLVAPMKKAGVFPSLSLHLIEVGEETGNLPSMLLQSAEVYEGEVRVEIKRLINLLEPLLILFMGVVVGLIVVSMIYSIFSINEIPS